MGERAAGDLPAVADIADPFLRHKTTHRDIYERALKTAGEADDVILWNRRGEITESTIANVVVEKLGIEAPCQTRDTILLPYTAYYEL